MQWDSKYVASPSRAAVLEGCTLAKKIDYEWIESADAFDDLIATLSDEPRYGLDTEFLRERTYFPQLALIQLSWSEGVALVDPLAVPVAPLRRLLESDAVAILHAASQDLEILQRECGMVPKKFFDTQIAGGFTGHGVASLGNLGRDALDVQIPKGEQLTDWMRRPLAERERSYAAGDVVHLLDLHDCLGARLEELGRTSWAAEEMELERKKDRGPRTPEHAWWKIKGKGKFSGSSMGVAQEVAAWRERRAAKLDRLTRNVLSDLALMGVAHRAPKSRQELSRIRGLDARFLSKGADEEILAAVQRGENLPREEVRTPPKSAGGRGGAAGALCMAWVGAVGEKLGLESSLLANRDDVTGFVRGDDSRLRHGWRHEEVGRDLEGLLAGKLAVSLNGVRELELVPRG